MEVGYGLEASFERVVLYCCCCRPAFWRRIGCKLDPKRMGDPLAAFILAACAAIARESGRPPSSTVVVVQHINRWHVEGRIKRDTVVAVLDLLEAAEDAGVPPIEEIVAELVPIVRRKMHSEAVLLAHDEFARRTDFSDVVSMLRDAARLGEVTSMDEVALQASGLAILEADRTDRLRTPSAELDIGLGGGLRRGGLGVVMGDSGGGKSMFLTSQAVCASRCSMHVALATLELPYQQQFARVAANLTGVWIDDLLDSKDARLKAAKLLKETEDARGPVHIAEFSPYATTVRDLVEWVDQKEQDGSSKVDLLVVDYADKLSAPNVRDGNEYLAMRHVYEGLRRDVASERDMWVWSASQPKNRDRKERKHLLDMNDAADSSHKYRACDLFVTINYEDPNDRSQALYFVAKNRGGAARFTIGPLPTDFARGRMCAEEFGRGR